MTTLTAPSSERALIGAVLASYANGIGLADESVLSGLSPQDFNEAPHRVIWRAVTDLNGEGIDPTPGAVAARLEQQGGTELRPLVYELAAGEIEPASYHAGILRDRAMRRRLAEALHLAGQQVGDLQVPIADLMDAAERSVFAVADRGGVSYPAPVKSKLASVFALIESGGYKGTPTGYHDLDKMLTGRGFLPGQLVVVAGATSMGKTAFATGLACGAAIEQKRPVAVYSIEMTTEDNALRILCHEARADLKAVAEGDTTEHDMVNIANASRLVAGAPLFLEDGANTVSQIRSSARRLKMETGLDLLIVDHLQDMEGPGDNRREQIGGIARKLKAVAKELDLTVVLLSQLSRAVDKRPDPRPRLTDLKEAGEIENSSDTVLLLYRPEYYFGPEMKVGRGKNEKTVDVRGRAELIVAKQRNGETGTVHLTWVPHCVRYDNAENRRWS